LKKYKVIFAGTPLFACPALESLIKDDRFEIQAIITQENKPVGRKQIITTPPVKSIGDKNGILVLQPRKISNIYEDLKALSPEFLVVIAYGQILPKKILDIAKWNINLHASLLPKYRGASPIQSALLQGETETGVSVMNIEEKMDAGAVYKTHILSIHPKDTSEILFHKLAEIGKNLPNDLVDISSGIEAEIQNESEASYCKKISKADAEIHPNLETADEIYNRLRAFTPWPGIFFMNEGKRIKIISGEIMKYNSDIQEPENTLSSLGIKARLGYFLPERIIPEGKKETDFRSWVKNLSSKRV
jgi:methionyl-tRNA formyltransferase